MIHAGDCIEVMKTMADASVHCCVTSPPYWGLRDYGHEGQIGLEQTPDEYVAKMVEVFREVRRVLRDDGTLWLNLGDSYNGYNGNRGASKGKANERSHKIMPSLPKDFGLVAPFSKNKDLVGIPWRVAFALQSDGWYLRQDIIWHKPGPMPESVRDRCTKAHEYIFLLSKSPRYYYDAKAIAEPAVKADILQSFDKLYMNAGRGSGRRASGNEKPGSKPQTHYTRNKRSVWTVTSKPFKGAHFAVFPPDLITPCILAGTSDRGCCPHCGAPWERVVEKTPSSWEARKSAGHVSNIGGNSKLQRLHGATTKFDFNEVGGFGMPAAATTIGWRPTCKCPEHGPVPCTVLDPFTGSGTTGVVAAKHRRRFAGCELNPEYAAMAEKRIAEEQNLFSVQDD